MKLSNDADELAQATSASTSSVAGLRITMTILPIMGLLAAFVIFKNKYILTDEKLEEIVEKLKVKG